MSHLRDAFRSGDIWLTHSRRYGDLKQALVPIEAAKATPLVWRSRSTHRNGWMTEKNVGLMDLSVWPLPPKPVPFQVVPLWVVSLRLDRLTADVPAKADELVLDLYRRLPDVQITDMLLDVEKATGFIDAFTHLRTGAPCRDKIGLLNVLLAEGLNLGLSKMAEAI
jgi:hypothetical protein